MGPPSPAGSSSANLMEGLICTKKASFGVRAFGRYPETETVWGERSGLLTKERGGAFPRGAAGHPLFRLSSSLPWASCPHPTLAPNRM